MIMKIFNFAALVAVIVSLSACNSSDEMLIEVQKDNNLVRKISYDTKEIAQLMTSIPLTSDVVSEVFDAAQDGIENGIEESYYLAEVFGETTKSATRSGAGSLLARELCNAMKGTRSNNLNEKMLQDEDYQIYWPYSDRWDGVSQPVITFVPEDVTQLWNYAYKQTEHGVDTIVVDEDYMKSHPVWIINKADFSYEMLPNFNNNEFEKHGVRFNSRKNQRVSEIRANIPETRAVGDNVYTLYMGKFMAEHQFDYVWAGGSEFFIKSAAIDGMKIVDESQLKSENIVGYRHPIFLTRSQIDKKEWITLYGVTLTSDWHNNEHTLSMLIYEEDQGGSDNHYKSKASVTIGSKNYAYDIDIQYGSDDDYIFNGLYWREAIFSTNNAPGKIHSAGNLIHWTLPYEIGTVLY